MTSIIARTGLTLAIAFAIILLTAPESRSAAAAAGRDRTCHFDATENRKVGDGVQQWLVRQIDRWCVRDGRVVSVRQTLEVETGPDWKLVSKSGTSRVAPDGTATSQGRFHLAKRGKGKSCYPKVTGTLRPDGVATYGFDNGC